MCLLVLLHFENKYKFFSGIPLTNFFNNDPKFLTSNTNPVLKYHTDEFHSLPLSQPKSRHVQSKVCPFIFTSIVENQWILAEKILLQPNGAMGLLLKWFFH
jgi:hypothetical protein